MIQKADELMYFVKSHGKSNVKYAVVSSPDAENKTADTTAQT